MPRYIVVIDFEEDEVDDLPDALMAVDDLVGASGTGIVAWAESYEANNQKPPPDPLSVRHP